MDISDDTKRKFQIPTIRIEHYDDEPDTGSHATDDFVEDDNLQKGEREPGDQVIVSPSNSPAKTICSSNENISSCEEESDAVEKQSSSCDASTSIEKPDSGSIQETLADIAQNFTSKLEGIRSTFTMSLDRKVSSYLGKKK